MHLTRKSTAFVHGAIVGCLAAAVCLGAIALTMSTEVTYRELGGPQRTWLSCLFLGTTAGGFASLIKKHLGDTRRGMTLTGALVGMPALVFLDFVSVFDEGQHSPFLFAMIGAVLGGLVGWLLHDSLAKYRDT